LQGWWFVLWYAVVSLHCFYCYFSGPVLLTYRLQSLLHENFTGCTRCSTYFVTLSSLLHVFTCCTLCHFMLCQFCGWKTTR
jgi:hypothetical protein